MTLLTALQRLFKFEGPQPDQTGKIYISGTGRAGTTFLVELLTELGFDTGFAEGAHPETYFSGARAGYEWDLSDTSGPRIQKSPYLCDRLDEVVAGGTRVSWLIVPVRNISDAARSRVKVQRDSTGSGDGPSVAGGLWSTEVASDQENVLRAKLSCLIESAVRHDIPMLFLDFPRFANDVAYTHDKLKRVFPEIEKKRFSEAFVAVSRPELISKF